MYADHLKYFSSISSVIQQKNIIIHRVLHKYITQSAAYSLKRAIIQFKIMCIKILSIMFCANPKNKTMSPYTAHKTV